MSRANLQIALEAVEKLVVRLGGKGLAEKPELAPLRRSLLEKALNIEAELVGNSGGDPLVRRKYAEVTSRLAGSISSPASARRPETLTVRPRRSMRS